MGFLALRASLHVSVNLRDIVTSLYLYIRLRHRYDLCLKLFYLFLYIKSFTIAFRTIECYGSNYKRNTEEESLCHIKEKLESF